MKQFGIFISVIFMSIFINVARAESDSNVYAGFGISSLALDSERVIGVPTRSPGHTPKIGSLFLGYQFNNRWSLDLTLGTDFSNNVNTDQVSINGYRFFGEKNWKPYLSAGVSSFSINDATVDQTEQVQVGFGLSGALSDNLELRAGYQHFFEFGDTSYNDDGVTVALNWHFRKPRTAIVARATPQPESIPKKKEVAGTFELLVQFDFDRSNIKSVYKPQFDMIARELKESPDKSMTVEGYTDSIGTEGYNQGLSERRAEAVGKKFIQDYGIASGRISTKGYGESHPVADNNTAEGRAKNRRAFAVILKPGKATE
ncbi:MAG TPA: OmpA family protein [Gammaproteobacteria bacterium]|nr:OmpA family protein [Gammaproteobacteria bacterium]